MLPTIATVSFPENADESSVAIAPKLASSAILSELMPRIIASAVVNSLVPSSGARLAPSTSPVSGVAVAGS